MKEESEKAGLKLNIQKTKILAFGLLTLWQINGKTMETVTDFIFLGSKITANCGKFLKTWEYQTTLPTSCKTYMQIKKKQLELDMEPQTASKLGKELCILSPCLFNLYAKYIMRNAELKEHKLESSLPGEISTTSDMQMTPL